jgi:serine/threonine protein kinase
MSLVLAPLARLDAFEIRALLDQGVHTATYSASHPRYGDVILQQYLPLSSDKTDLSQAVGQRHLDSVNATALAAFGDVARSLCAIQHPGLPRGLAYVEAGTTAFLVTRHVQGATLASLLTRPHPLSAVEKPLGAVLNALGHLHESGLFHGSITPDTIVLQGANRAVLVGYGALEWLGLKTSRQAVESGTAAAWPNLPFPKIERDYAPPETWQGEPPGTATDVYAVGAILYLALTGSKPPDALRRVRAIAMGQPDPYVPVARACSGNLAPGVAPAVDGALALSRASRIRTMAELAAGLGWDHARDPLDVNVAWIEDKLSPPRGIAARPGARFLPAAALGAAFLALSSVPALVGLSGLVGWKVEPREVVFEGPAGGPFKAENKEIILVWSDYAVSLKNILYPNRMVLRSTEKPAWVEVTANMYGTVEALEFEPSALAGALSAGDHKLSVVAEFPWGRTGWPVAQVILRVHPTSASQPSNVIESPPNLEVNNSPERLAQPERQGAAEARSTPLTSEVNNPPERLARPERQGAAEARSTSSADMVCDERAGLRFDQDRSPSRPHLDDTGTLSQDELGDAITRCTSAARRQGANRRFAVQLGRLLAERAVRQGRAGQGRAAESDMVQALTQWREAERRGSAYAANLIGTYYSGTYNRSGKMDFVASDITEAVRAWRRSMERGNVIGQRNYAAQLLSGNGVAQDIRTALNLLQDAANKGDDRAASILGVAYYTGYPIGVGKDQAQGWQLLKRAPCDAGDARTLIRNEISRSRQSAAGMPNC